jgi:putative PIN family toxin of toxin-antitoxin system
MRVVLDTNVVVSATLIRGKNEDRILRAWRRGAFELVLSPQILDEMGQVLFYERLQQRQWTTQEEIVALLQAFAQESILVSGRVAVKASRDPEDDKFLGAAVEGRARYVVSGDQDLLEMKAYRGIRIVRPAVFLDILTRVERTKP